MTSHIKIKGREHSSLFLSFIFAFTLMAAYYLLRPLRDAMVCDWTDTTLSTIWTAQFILSLAVSLFMALLPVISVLTFSFPVFIYFSHSLFWRFTFMPAMPITP